LTREPKELSRLKALADDVLCGQSAMTDGNYRSAEKKQQRVMVAEIESTNATN
jgi:hypothetical protein